MGGTVIAGGATWTYAGGDISYPLGWQGSLSMTSNSPIVPISWIDAQKGEPIINGTISTTWNAGGSCTSVTHTVQPLPLPAGISIVDDIDIGGIVVSGRTTDLLTTTIKNNYTDIYANKGVIASNTLPPDSMLTHYTSLNTKYIDYTITVTVNYGGLSPGSAKAAWILRFWNTWETEKEDVKKLAAQEVKGV